MCPPKTKIPKADVAAAPPPPPMDAPKAPIVNETSRAEDPSGARRGNRALRIPLVGGAPSSSGVNLPS